MPKLRQVFQALAEAGALANWLHIAGPAAPILQYYANAGVHLANFDYVVSAAEAKDKLPLTCLNGNIKPLLFVDGSPQEIERAALDLLRAFSDRRGFILSSGCEIPPEAKPGNVAALANAAKAKWQ